MCVGGGGYFSENIYNSQGQMSRYTHPGPVQLPVFCFGNVFDAAMEVASHPHTEFPTHSRL